MPMSEEKRREASERMKARHAANRAERTAVAEPDEDDFEVLRPDGRPVNTQEDVSVLSRTELFRSRARNGAPVTTSDDLLDLAGEDRDILEAAQGASNVEHASAGRVWMYKKETWGWHRIPVSRNSVDEVLKAGYLDRCGDCGSSRCPGQGQNDCTGRAPVAYRICPVPGCNANQGGPKKFYDNTDFTAVMPSADPFAIIDTAYAQSTPESRTKAALDAHLRAYHETTAQAMGLFNIQSGAA